MATTVKVQNLTALGDIAVGDKFVGERVAGQTRLITYTPRTLEGAPNSITVVNGNQVSGNPVFSISSTYVGQTSITTLGTVATGVWSATAIGVVYGGTGLTSTTANQLLYSSSNNVIAGLTTANSGVLVTSALGVPSIGTDIPTAVTIGGQYIYRAGGTDIPLADGGLNASLTADNGGIFYSTAAAGAILASTATANKMLLSGASAAPTWSTSTIPTSAGAAGKILISDGTNYALSTPKYPNASGTARKILVSDGTDYVASTETWATPGVSGQVLTSDGTNWTSAAAPSGTAATQADQETATSTATYVSPGRQQYHPSAAKAWVFCGVTGNILASYNVSSVTDTGAGDALVNFTTSFSSANYSGVVSLQINAAGQVPETRTHNVGSCQIRCINSAGAPADPDNYNASFYGDQ